MEKLVTLFIFATALLFTTSCKKDNPELIDQNQPTTEESSLNGTWEVIWWKEMVIDEYSDTVLMLYSNYSSSIEEVDSIWEVTATANTFITPGEEVLVDGEEYKIDLNEPGSSNPNSEVWRHWIWIEKVDPEFGDIYYYMLGKRE